MRCFEYNAQSLDDALTMANQLLSNAIEVAIRPGSSGYVVRAPQSATSLLPDGAKFVVVESPAEAALRSLVGTIDEMRTAGSSYVDADTAHDGPDHWFGGFTNFAVSFDSDRVALSWPNLSIVADQSRSLLDSSLAT